MSDNQISQKNSAIGSKRAWFIWGLSALTFGYAFFHRVAPSIMVNDLMADFAIGATIIGTLSSLYFYPYVIMQVFLGALLDRIGPRVILTIALLAAGAGSVLFGTAETLGVAYAARILIGIGCAVGFLSTLTIAGKWFPPEKFAFLAGLVMFFGMMSGVFASGPLAIFVEQFGWRYSMWSLGIFSLILATLIFLFVRNEPETSIEKNNQPKESWGAFWRGLGKAASTREVWKIAFVASAMSGPMLALGTLWATPYLSQAYDIPRAEAAFSVSFTLFGWALGAPFFGALSDRIKRRKIILCINSFVLVLALCPLLFLPPLPIWVTISLFAIIGLTGSAMSVTFALAREVNDKSISGSILGIVNSMTVASGAVLQPIVGFLLDWFWDGTLIDGSRVYSTENYQTAFTAILAVSVIGFLVSLTLKESPINPRNLAK